MSGRSWELHDIRHAAAGAAILGSGGGGGYQDALLIINQLALDPKWSGTVTVKDYDGSSPCSVIFMMGSPDAAGEMSLDEFGRCIGNALSVQTSVCGFTPTCAIPIETGPINSLAPVIAAALQLGGVTWVVDGDGAGRAVPELPQTTYAGAPALPVSPCVVADNAKLASQVQSGVLTTTTTPKAEALAGAVVSAFGSFAGVSMWPSSQSNGYALSGQYIPGTLEQSRALGKFLHTQPDTAAVARHITHLTKREAAAVVTNYYITHVKQATDSSSSLDAGVIRLDTDPDPVKSTDTVYLYNMNENLIAYSTGQAAPLIVAPDSICYYSEDEAAGFSNATPDLALYYDFSKNRSTGKKVSLIKVAAAPQLVATPGVQESFAKLLRSIGYAGALSG